MMASIQTKDKMDGSSNFNHWKARVIKILKEHDLDHYMTTIVVKPTSRAG
jgi:hypothetical protein